MGVMTKLSISNVIAFREQISCQFSFSVCLTSPKSEVHFGEVYFTA